MYRMCNIHCVLDQKITKKTLSSKNTRTDFLKIQADIERK